VHILSVWSEGCLIEDILQVRVTRYVVIRGAKTSDLHAQYSTSGKHRFIQRIDSWCY
jgi:hypothetical protein